MKITNYVYSFTEYIVEILIIFIIFKIVIVTVGVKYLGIWSLAISFTSITAIGSSGFASSAVKFVAQNFALNDTEKVKKILITTIVVVGFFSTITTSITYLVIYRYGSIFLKINEIKVVNTILLPIFGSFILGSLSRVLLSAMDGMLKIKERSVIGIIGKIFYLTAAIILTYEYKLLGLAFALLIKDFVLLMLSIIVIQKNLNFQQNSLKYFDKYTLKEIFNYGYKFQINSVLQMFTDPVTKILIKKFSGLEALGLFEVVYKIFFQARMIIIVLMNTYLPIIASKKTQSQSKDFIQFYKYTFIFSSLLLMSIFPFNNIINYILDIGNVKIMNIISIQIFIGLLYNLLGSTAYIYNLGSGRLNNNLISTVMFSAINIIAGFLLGRIYEFYGVLLGWMLAHILSSTYLIYKYVKYENILINKILNASYIRIHLQIIIFVSMIAYINQLEMQIFLTILLNIVLFAIFSLLVYKRNFIIRESFKYVFKYLHS